MRPWLSMSTTCKLTKQALQKRNYCQRFNFENFDDVPEALAQFDKKKLQPATKAHAQNF